MNRKLILMDVDGTLCNHEGDVPSSTRRAIQLARQQGHLVFLCTGRSKAELYDFIMDVGFDGVIGAGGGYVTIGETTLFHHMITPEKVRHLVDFFNEHHIDFYLECHSGLYASQHLVEHLEMQCYGDLFHDPEAQRKKLEHPNIFITSMIQGQDLYRQDVNKVSFLDSDIPFAWIRKEFENDFNVICNGAPDTLHSSGELGIPGIHKATAIAALLDYLQFPKEDTFAFGDGLNDIEMLQFCHIGIAMGNAKQGLKDIADDITLDCNQGGIEASFKKYGLIPAD